MANSFKQQVSQQRAAVPQVDPEGEKVRIPAPVPSVEPQVYPETAPEQAANRHTPLPQSLSNGQHITIVDTSEPPVNRGFFMYPSRHRQIAKDLAYIEDRKPWQIIEEALEEYIVKHYGKAYKRK